MTSVLSRLMRAGRPLSCSLDIRPAALCLGHSRPGRATRWRWRFGRVSPSVSKSTAMRKHRHLEPCSRTARAGRFLCADAHLLEGFAAYGGSVRAAIAPLVECFGVELFDDGVALRQPTTDAATVIGSEELGNSSDGQTAARIQRDQLPARSIATALRLTYYDRERDFQTGEARAVVSERLGNEAQQEVPAVFTAAAAKSLAQQIFGTNLGRP